MGGVELPAGQGTVPVWDVPSFFFSLPTSFGSVLLPLSLPHHLSEISFAQRWLRGQKAGEDIEGLGVGF